MQQIASLISKQRQLIADMETDEQISVLQSLIKRPPQNSRVVQISPELAMYILENLNVGNRTQKRRSINLYSRDMANNNWSLTGQPIVFGNHGYLLDGQNRLAACVRAGVPFTSHAVFGVEPSSFVHFDIGKNRSAADVFTIMGIKYPRETGFAVRMLYEWSRGLPEARGIALTNDDLRAMYNKMDTDLLELAIKFSKKANQTTSYPVSSLTSLFYTAAKNGDLDLAKKFMEDLSQGFGKGPRSPIRLLLETIIRLKMDKTVPLTMFMYNILLIRTWNNYKLGKASMKKDMQFNKNDVLPDVY